MTIGPIHIIVYSFDRIDRFRGEVLEELARLRESGEIRLIDLLLAVKEPDGQITATEMNDLTPDESVEFGVVIGRLLGFSDISMASRDPGEMTADAVERMLAASSQSLGIDYEGIQKLVLDLQPGKAFAVLMFEHTWAIPLREAIRRAGGVPRAQGFLTRDALMIVGNELQGVDHD